jgi:phosphoglycolate phosphatase
VVFDLDGTLVDTAPDLLGALNHVLEHLGLAPVGLPAVAAMIGHGARAMIETGLKERGAALGPADMDRAFDRFIAHYIAHIAVASRPYEGAPEALDALAAGGAALAVCTNKRQDLSDRLLGALDLAPRFRAIVGADRAVRRKPDAAHVLQAVAEAGGAPERALFVGDSRTDERAARNAGLPFIFVPFGYESEPASALQPDAVLGHYEGLLPVVSELMRQAPASLRGR